MRQPPEHLRHLSGDELWRQFRRNGRDLWRMWDEDLDNGLAPSMLEAAEFIEAVEAVGGTIHINLDVELPADVDPLDRTQQLMLRENGELIRELLRFTREAEATLTATASR